MRNRYLSVFILAGLAIILLAHGTARPASAKSPPAPEAGSAAAVMTKQLNDFSQWKNTGGKWKVTRQGRINGSGQSRLRFKPKLPKTFRLSFRMNVISGLRTRIYMARNHELYIGHEGGKRTIWAYGKKLTLVSLTFVIVTLTVTGISNIKKRKNKTV